MTSGAKVWFIRCAEPKSGFLLLWQWWADGDFAVASRSDKLLVSLLLAAVVCGGSMTPSDF